MHHLTIAGKFIHYAVEVYAVEARSNDGYLYVLCLTQSLEVAKLVSESQVHEGEHGEYRVGRVIPYEAGQEVWLGFPFPHRGAKALVRGQVTEEQHEFFWKETDLAIIA
ncbi:MAG: hypothetical protein IPK84_02695 [Candidatus Moraniibacteriota bacterium]|nr:MAG: hypothetical protein IPK84_02695 [Candidatus Moranbacteria bacterium]